MTYPEGHSFPRPQRTPRFERPWTPGPLTREVIVGNYRLTGEWCETARLLFPQGVPADIRRDAVAARAAFDPEAWFK